MYMIMILLVFITIKPIKNEAYKKLSVGLLPMGVVIQLHLILLL